MPNGLCHQWRRDEFSARIRRACSIGVVGVAPQFRGTDMKIVDPHFHIWDLENYHYPWLASPGDGGLNGNYRAICRTYLLPEYRHEGTDFEVIKSVHVQAEIDPADPVAETAWLQQIADDPMSDGMPNGIVAFCNLADPNAQDVLEANAGFANVRGVRHLLNTSTDPRLAFTPTDWLNDPAWQAGYSLLSRFDLSFDLQIYSHQMADAARLARKHPSTRMILNHAGMPHDDSVEGIDRWRTGLRALAACENAAVKISGLGMMNHQWTTENIRPYVLDVIEIFGTDRACFASNFPVDRLYSGFDTLWQAFSDITSDASPDDRTRLFQTTAERLYRI
jgi:predicted TIM-barrel fold metal-dependent hydrolase